MFFYNAVRVVCLNRSGLQGKQESILEIPSVWWSRSASYEQQSCQSSGAQFVWVARPVLRCVLINQDVTELLG